jgi:broad specificity phosphatase PhoE
MRPSRILLTVVALLAVLASRAEAQQTIFLVRHAEKADTSDDPLLSPAGKARAKDLARLLGDAGVTAINTSPFRRTVKTAEPLASKLGLEIKKEFIGDSAAFASLLKQRHPKGVVLVVGHSTTVPELLKALGHAPNPPIQIREDEFDNLFVVTPGEIAHPTVVRLRYGK